MKLSAIERLLPDVFQRATQPGTPLRALLEVMEAQHDPSEQVLESLDRYFNPYQTPDAFVPYLAQWLDLARILTSDGGPEGSGAEPASGMGRLRELIAAAVYLSKLRGTARGLVLFLEIATGEQGFVIDEHTSDEHGRARRCHLHIIAPASCAEYRPLIERIIAAEKPAYATHDLVIAEQ